MSLVSFSKIFGVNFNSYGEFELNITPGRHLVLGENGSGKSSLFESLVKTLKNKYLRGNDPSFNGKGDCVTGTTFSAGGKEYTVERYHGHHELKNSAKLYIDNKDISARITEDVNAEIDKIIPIPYDIFVSSVVVLQGLPVNFTQFTASVRKTLFEDALNLPWDKYRNKFNKELKAVNDKKNILDNDYRTKENEFTSVSSKLEALREATKINDSEISKKLSEVDAELESLNEQKESLIGDIQDIVGNEELEDIEERNGQLLSSMAKFNHELSLANSILKNKSCPTCARPFPDEKMEKAAQTRDSLENKIKMMKSRIDIAKKKLDSARKIETEIRRIDTVALTKKRERNSLSAEMDKVFSNVFNPEIEDLQKRFDQLYKELEEKQGEIETANEDLENLRFIDETLLPASKFRTSSLLDYLNYVNVILKKISPIVFPDVSVYLKTNSKVTGIDIEIKRKGKSIDYKQLSGGEKRRLDVAVILAFQRFLIEVSGVKTNLMVLDEIFDCLDKVGVDTVINCIESLYPPNMAIYVISHNQELKSRFDSVIKVTKDSAGRSHIESV